MDSESKLKETTNKNTVTSFSVYTIEELVSSRSIPLRQVINVIISKM